MEQLTRSAERTMRLQANGTILITLSQILQLVEIRSRMENKTDEKYFGFVKPGGKIAVQGASGAGAKDKNGNPVYHLHLEADSDTAYPSSTPSEGGGVDTTIDPLSILYKTKEQVVEPDCEDEKSAVDEEGRPWYDIDKITSIPTI